MVIKAKPDMSSVGLMSSGGKVWSPRGGLLRLNCQHHFPPLLQADRGFLQTVENTQQIEV